MSIPSVWDWLQSLGNGDLQQFPFASAERQFQVDSVALAEYRHQVLTPIQSRVYTGPYRATTDVRTRNPLHLMKALEVGQRCFVALGADGDRSECPRPERLNMVELKHIRYDEQAKRHRYFAQFYVTTKPGVEFDFSRNFGPAYRPEAVLEEWADPSEIPDTYLLPGLPFGIVRKVWKSIKNNDTSFRYVDDVREVFKESLIVNEFVPTVSNGISERFKRRIQDALAELQSAWDQGVKESVVVHPEAPVESTPVGAKPRRKRASKTSQTGGSRKRGRQ